VSLDSLEQKKQKLMGNYRETNSRKCLGYVLVGSAPPRRKFIAALKH